MKNIIDKIKKIMLSQEPQIVKLIKIDKILFSNDGKTKTIEIELEKYKEWLTELERFVKVGETLNLYEESGCTDYELIVKEISKIVFEED